MRETSSARPPSLRSCRCLPSYSYVSSYIFFLFFFKSVGLDTVVPVPSLYEISDEINSNAPNARQSANSSCGRVVERVANEETTKKETWETEPASLDSIVRGTTAGE